MQVTVDIGGMIEFLLLGEVPGGDDEASVIGISTVAYIAKKDPAHVFLPAAIWHDAAYVKGSSAQSTMMRHEVDVEFFKKCIDIANSPTLNITQTERFELEKEAVALFLMVRKYGDAAWENAETKD